MQGQPAPDGFEFTDDRCERSTVAPMPASPLPAHETPSAPVTATSAAAARSAKPLTAKADKPEKPDKPDTRDKHDRPDKLAKTAAESSAVATAVAACEPPSEHASRAVAPAASTPAPPARKPPPAEPTVGQMLSRARQSRRLSLEAASARTRIPVKMLDHLEHDRFGEFAAAAYARGSLRAYGTFLGLDAGTLVQRYDELVAPVIVAEDIADPTEPTVEIEAVSDDAPSRPSGGRRAPILALVGGIAAAGLGWGVYTLATRNPVELRPRAGLTQIEDELRRSQATTAAPAPATAVTPPPPSEDTAAPAPVVAPPASAPALPRSDADVKPPAAPKPAPITDLVAEPGPQHPNTPPAAAPPVAAPPAVATPRPAIVIPAGALVLQATALGPCAVRVQIDNDIAGAALHQFAAGETYTWAARRSFRLTPQRGVNLQLLLDGKPVATPADGQSLRLDRGTHEPATPTPRRRRGRARTTSTRHAPATQPAPAIEPHGGVPPPR
jgi:cytoskeletal protein RodZ